jgi:prepilin-type processing-associated H-X9-DG protein
VGMALLLYANEDDGYIDGTHHSIDPPDIIWYDAASNYLGSTRLIFSKYYGGIGCGGMDPRARADFTYTANWMFAAYPAYSTGILRHSLAEVRRPSLTYLVGEGWYPINYPGYMFGQSASGNGTFDWLPRHGKRGLNFFFVDGHVAFLTARVDLWPSGQQYYTDTQSDQSDWVRWGDLNGIPYPYVTEWAPLNLYTPSPGLALYGQ